MSSRSRGVMLYCELVTVTYRLSSGKRRLVYSISTLLLPSLSLSLSALASNENRILYPYISRIRLFFSIATLPVLKYFFIYFRREENMHVDRNEREKKKRCGRANESLAFPVNCGFMVYRSGETFYRWSITSR